MNDVPYHHGHLRDALIEAAVKAIAEQGVDALSLRSLARDVGVTHAAPYRHFETRNHLLAAVAEAGFKLLHAQMLPVLQGPDMREAFRAAGGVYVRFAVEQPGYYQVMYGPTRLTAGYADGIDMLGPRDMPQYEELVEPLCDDGSDARAATIAGWAIVHGIATLVVDGRLRPDMFDLPDGDYEGLVRILTTSYVP